MTAFSWVIGMMNYVGRERIGVIIAFGTKLHREQVIHGKDSDLGYAKRGVQ